MADNIAERLVQFDDLTVVANDLSARRGFTLTSRVRNEMYFLPAFLSHYRGLGVERFVFLDDRSTDGTRAFLAGQPDCMIVASRHRFNEIVQIDPPLIPGHPTMRMSSLWINLLAAKYAGVDWTLHVDADEFLRLPPGETVADLAARLDALGANLAWSVMIDMYPATIADLKAEEGAARLHLDDTWHYDAREHFRFRRDGRLRVIYPGSRARLMATYRILPATATRFIRLGFRMPGYNIIRKPAFFKLPQGGFLTSPHSASFPGARGILLPLEHFKFTGQLYRRMRTAIAEGTHHANSIEYRDMERLLGAMEAQAGSFLCRRSSSDRSFSAYRTARIAKGL